jgi:hypothetical protein
VVVDEEEKGRRMSSHIPSPDWRRITFRTSELFLGVFHERLGGATNGNSKRTEETASVFITARGGMRGRVSSWAFEALAGKKKNAGWQFLPL